MNSGSGSRANSCRFAALPLILAAAVFLCDQAGKLWIARFSGLEHGAYPPYGGIEVVPGFFSIVYSTNTGAAWGMFSGHGYILALVGIIVLVLLVAFRKHLGLERRPMQIVAGLMAGGIVGNLFDRLLLGRVTDFLDFHIGTHHWPTFNIADSAMVIAVCLYFLMEILEPKKESRESQS